MSSYPLLTGPIGRSLWRLAAPTAAAMVTQILVAIAETYFFGWLGTEALAGFALVYPLMMLMQMMASGGLGGGGTSPDGIFMAIAAGIILCGDARITAAGETLGAQTC